MPNGSRRAHAFWGHKWAPNWLFGAAVALQLKRWAGGLGLTGKTPTPPRHMHALAALLKPWGCRGAQQCLTPKGGGGDTCPRCAYNAGLLLRYHRVSIARALVSSHSLPHAEPLGQKAGDREALRQRSARTQSKHNSAMLWVSHHNIK